MKCKLSEICSFTTGKLNSNAAVENGKYPFFTCSPETLKINDYAFDQEAILLAGNNAEGNFNIKYYVGKFNAYQRTYVFSAAKNCYLKYLYYSLKLCLENFKQISQGTATKFLTAKILNSFEIELPSLDIQKKIASILTNLDDKIELNNAINHNLQQQAQALYHKIFSSSPHPDWQRGVLSDIAIVIMGQSPDGKSYNENGVGMVFYQGRAEFGARFPMERLFTTEPKRIAQENDILISVRAPVGDLNVAKEKCCIGRGLAALQSKDKHQSYLLYTMFALRSKLDVFNGEGTVFGSINREALNSLSISIPPIAEMDKFEALAAPIDKLIRTNFDEIYRLQIIRDTLLPRLMSGELDVSEVEI